MSKKYAITFLILAAALAAMGVAAWGTIGLGAIAFGYTAFSFLLLAVAYGKGGVGLLGKSPDGRLRPSSWLLFAPYHALNRISLWLYRRTSREPALVQVVSNLYFGRRLSSRESCELLPHHCIGVLDLAGEFSEVHRLREVERYRSLPILDGTAPAEELLWEAVGWLRELVPLGPVYVHCALGHGRSATVVVAYLLSTGLVGTALEGERRLRSLRGGPAQFPAGPTAPRARAAARRPLRRRDVRIHRYIQSGVDAIMKSFALDSNDRRDRPIDARLRLANRAARIGMYLLGIALVVAMGTNVRAQTPSRPDPVSFRRQVAPILVKKCLACHDDRKASGGLSLATFAALDRGGKTVGEAILDPGDPESSYLITTIRRGAPIRMPYKQPPLKDDEVALLTRWVKDGARFDGPSAAETPLAALVDVLADLPKVALKVPAADAVSSLAFSPDGRHLAAAVGRQVVLYDVGTGKLEATLGDHPGPVTSVRFTPDGTSLVAAGGRPGLFGSIIVWDVIKRQKRLDVAGHSDAILAAAVAPGHKLLATAGYDKQVLIWDLATGKVVRPLKDHSDAVYGLAFSPDGKTLASCAADRTVKLWDWAAGRRTVTLSESTAELYAVAFTPDGSHVLAAGVDRSIRMWRVESHGAGRTAGAVGLRQ